MLYPSGLCVSLCVMLRWPWSLWPNSIFPTQKAGLPGVSGGQESTCNAGGLGSIPGLERSLEKEMATHSSILAWESPWTEEPGGLQSTGHKESHTPEWLNTAQKDWGRCLCPIGLCAILGGQALWSSHPVWTVPLSPCQHTHTEELCWNKQPFVRPWNLCCEY